MSTLTHTLLSPLPFFDPNTEHFSIFFSLPCQEKKYAHTRARTPLGTPLPALLKIGGVWVAREGRRVFFTKNLFPLLRRGKGGPPISFVWEERGGAWGEEGARAGVAVGATNTFFLLFFLRTKNNHSHLCFSRCVRVCVCLIMRRPLSQRHRTAAVTACVLTIAAAGSTRVAAPPACPAGVVTVCGGGTVLTPAAAVAVGAGAGGCVRDDGERRGGERGWSTFDRAGSLSHQISPSPLPATSTYACGDTVITSTLLDGGVADCVCAAAPPPPAATTPAPLPPTAAAAAAAAAAPFGILAATIAGALSGGVVAVAATVVGRRRQGAGSGGGGCQRPLSSAAAAPPPTATPAAFVTIGATSDGGTTSDSRVVGAAHGAREGRRTRTPRPPSPPPPPPPQARHPARVCGVAHAAATGACHPPLPAAHAAAGTTAVAARAGGVGAAVAGVVARLEVT